MANDNLDPVVVDADRRAERARASLRSRFAQLEQRLGDVRDRLDLAAQIRRHPLPAVGLAVMLGMLAASRGHRRLPSVAGERSLGAAALAALGAIGLRIARELAVGQLSRAARHWLREHGDRLGADDLDEPRVIDATPGDRYLSR